MHIMIEVDRRRRPTGARLMGHEYFSRFSRRSYREDGKVTKETLANLSGLEDHRVAALRSVLGGIARSRAKFSLSWVGALDGTHLEIRSADVTEAPSRRCRTLI